MKSSTRKVVLARVLEDGGALAAHVLTPQVGDSSHGLSTERGFSLFVLRIPNMECVMFRAAELFGQNGRLCLTES